MLTVEPTGAILGATVHGIDVRRISDPEFAEILLALGNHGVLRFPGQHIDLGDLRTFSERFGEIQGPSEAPEIAKANYAHVGTLSNLKENGKYRRPARCRPGLAHRHVLSRRDGLRERALRHTHSEAGWRAARGTEFSNMHAVYDALPADIRTRYADTTATHDFEKFWEHMRRDKGSTRPPMSELQRRQRPPVVHPLFLTHPITGRKVLYANPGYTMRINGVPQSESDEILEYLFAFQLEPRFRHTHTWAENDLLVWDHLGTIHRAIADYGPDEIRLMRRCQVMATKVFDPDFLRPVRELMVA